MKLNGFKKKYFSIFVYNLTQYNNRIKFWEKTFGFTIFLK